MLILKFIFAAILFLGSLALIAAIDKPRQPLTPTDAIVALVFNLALIALLLAR
ncbi:MAG: hypothetical protein KGL39_42620 [Patescibacteria group bacterium]|nr:hypothetical protein [Patescibacteria group bacterium]